MIFKLKFDDREEFATAKDILHLLKEYDKESGLDIQTLEDLQEISDDEAKVIMLSNTDYDEDNPDEMPKEISVFDSAGCDDFLIIGSTEWL
jgi:hypothetical protein